MALAAPNTTTIAMFRCQACINRLENDNEVLLHCLLHAGLAFLNSLCSSGIHALSLYAEGSR
jgi:hypothetical protein